MLKEEIRKIKKLPPTKVFVSAGLANVSISGCSANHLQLSGSRNSIEQQMLPSPKENKSVLVLAEGTQNMLSLAMLIR